MCKALKLQNMISFTTSFTFGHFLHNKDQNVIQIFGNTSEEVTLEINQPSF